MGAHNDEAFCLEEIEAGNGLFRTSGLEYVNRDVNRGDERAEPIRFINPARTADRLSDERVRPLVPVTDVTRSATADSPAPEKRPGRLLSTCLKAADTSKSLISHERSA